MIRKFGNLFKQEMWLSFNEEIVSSIMGEKILQVINKPLQFNDEIIN